MRQISVFLELIISLYKLGDAVFCPGVVRPGSVLEKFVLELSGPKKKNPKFSCNKFHFFPKKIFVLEVWEETAWI